MISLYRNVPTRRLHTERNGDTHVATIQQRAARAGTAEAAEQLHPQQSRTNGLRPKTHRALPGQPSTVEYSYPTGVAQFYYWYRHLVEDSPFVIFWRGKPGYGSATRKLAPIQARATIWASAPTTTNVSLRTLIAAQGR